MKGTKGDAKRALIVAEAARLFDELGYARASMDDIAEASGLAKPTLYYYFRSKSEILFTIHEEFSVALEKSVTDRGVEETDDPDQALLCVIAGVLEVTHTHRSYVRVFFEHYRELGPAEYAFITERRDEFFARVEKLLLHRDGELNATKADARLTALAIFGMCNWAYTWYRSDGVKTPDEIAEHMWRLVLYGLDGRPAHDAARAGAPTA